MAGRPNDGAEKGAKRKVQRERCDMPHRVLILDDDEFLAQAAQWSVESVDRDIFPIIPVHTVDNAKQQFEQYRSAFLYAIVDLDMGNLPSTQQGEAFLEWLAEQGELQRVSVLVLSSYEVRLSSLRPDVSRHVQWYRRTASDADFDAAIRRFVTQALRRAPPKRALPDAQQ